MRQVILEINWCSHIREKVIAGKKQVLMFYGEVNLNEYVTC